jgi:AraC family transcriptional regulator
MKHPAPARPWSPCVVDGWRVSPFRSAAWHFAPLACHLLCAVRDGAVRVAGQRAGPGDVLLVQPGGPCAVEAARDAALEIVLFDAGWRRRQPGIRPGLGFRRRGDRPETPLAAWWGFRIPLRLPAELATAARPAVAGIGDLWWRGTGAHLLANARLAELLARIHLALAPPAPAAVDGFSELEAWAEQRLEQGVRAGDLARSLGVARSTLVLRCRRMRGTTPAALLRERRLARARELLETGTLPLAQVALHCGWRSRAAFAAAFKVRYALAPGAWRRQARRLPPPLPPISGVRRPERDFRPA